MNGLFGRGIGRRAFLAAAGVAAGAVTLAGGAADVFAQDKAKIKVASVYTVPIEQQWVGRIHKALKEAESRGEIEYVWAESVAATDYERVMRQYAEGGQQLIVGEAFAVERPVRAVAKDYPKTAFLMGSSFGPAGSNLSVFDNFIQEPAYMTGLIAGSMSKSGIIGMVGGYPIPEVNRLMNAFMEGAKETNPQIKFMVSFIGSWFDPPKAKEAAFAMIDRGADIMYAERFGVSDAAKERGKLVIDTQAQYPDTVVASALWHMEPTIFRAIAAVRENKFTAEDYGQFSTMKFNGSSLSPLGTFEKKIPEAVLAKVKEREQEIRDGLFRVNVNDSEPKSSM
jgi:basic membrane lipoprotein Med (substrate-binding protein (PBP1-ABC) superfamily)